jgi:hypothetical protein
MLTWHNVWMASHGRVIAQRTRQLGLAVAPGEEPLAALSAVGKVGEPPRPFEVEALRCPLRVIGCRRSNVPMSSGKSSKADVHDTFGHFRVVPTAELRLKQLLVRQR